MPLPTKRSAPYALAILVSFIAIWAAAATAHAAGSRHHSKRHPSLCRPARTSRGKIQTARTHKSPKRGRGHVVMARLSLCRVTAARVMGGRAPSSGAVSSTASPGASTTASPGLSWTGWNVLSNPITPAEQTALPFGSRSQWLQPWRAYLDTQPASMLRNAVGINFDVAPQAAASTAQLLTQSGFTRARLEIGWNQMSFANPSQLENPAAVDTVLGALKNAGIRPLILLNANDSDPGPSLPFTADITQSAVAGATTVQVDSTTASKLVPGLSGFNFPGGPSAAPAFIVTAVSPTGQVQLARPLPAAVAAGTYPGLVLRYAPFAQPFSNAGTPNTSFVQTLSGWLQYVKAVTTEAKKVLGNDNFDVEVWNELSFGSNFLSAANYYYPVPQAMQGSGSVADQLLLRTTQWIRSPANALPDVGIGDGFANQTPFVSGATVPAGVTAIDKHPYHESPYSFPQSQPFNGVRPVSAFGAPVGSTDSSGNWHDSFIPTYTAYFPEYTLSGIQTEFMERDLSPITTSLYGVPHGRYTAPSGSTTPPQTWITETGLDMSGATGMTTADRWHMQAKATLRTLAAFVNKGVSALDFYAAGDGNWAMVNPSAPGGGPTLTAVKSFTQAFAGPATIGTRRSLSLTQVADQGNWTQFAGDGTSANPPLYNRDVVAFFPFQVSTNKFVVPAYVMTRNIATLYNSSAPTTDVTRFDMPPQTYRLTVGGLNTAQLTVTAADPLTGSSVPVTVTPTSASTAVLEVPLTDYPRLLVLQDG
jgi:hypothetical protein